MKNVLCENPRPLSGLFVFLFITLGASAQWTAQTSGTTQSLRDVYFVSATTWTAETSNTNQTINSIFFFNANDGWAVANNGDIQKTGDGGANWADQNSGISNDLFDVTFVTANTGWVAP